MDAMLADARSIARVPPCSLSLLSRARYPPRRPLSRKSARSPPPARPPSPSSRSPARPPALPLTLSPRPSQVGEVFMVDGLLVDALGREVKPGNTFRERERGMEGGEGGGGWGGGHRAVSPAPHSLHLNSLQPLKPPGRGGPRAAHAPLISGTRPETAGDDKALSSSERGGDGEEQEEEELLPWEVPKRLLAKASKKIAAQEPLRPGGRRPGCWPCLSVSLPLPLSQSLSQSLSLSVSLSMSLSLRLPFPSPYL